VHPAPIRTKPYYCNPQALDHFPLSPQHISHTLYRKPYTQNLEPYTPHNVHRTP